MKSKLLIKSWLTFPAESIGDYPDGISQIYEGKIDGMLIKGVFQKSEMLKVKHKLEGKNDQEDVHFGKMLGAILTDKQTDRNKYFNSSALVTPELDDIFERSVESVIGGVLSKISGGRIVEVPRENDDSVYIPATVRFVEPNTGGIRVHKGNDFLDIAGWQYLNQIAKTLDSLSYFLVVEKGEQGGDLVLYEPPTDQLLTPTKDLELEKCQAIHISPDVGDMIVFRGGNIVHKVSDVKGSTTRITIGGFLAISKDDKKVFYWS
jgi:hypothetical protein